MIMLSRHGSANIGLSVLTSIFLMVSIIISAIPVTAQPDDVGERICGPPPPPKPARRKAAESYPPLPLPVVPMRRTEKKRPPAPPVLIAKLQYGKALVGHTADGRKYTFWDWNSDPGDMDGLFNFANARLGVRFRHENFPLARVSKELKPPAIYMMGHLAWSLTDQEVKGLREYLLNGGTWIVASGCGSLKFTNSFYREIKRVFPDKQLFTLAPDHPIYHSFYDVTEVKFRPLVG
ncbi:MAG TPA: DUF4159 domain-containing protein, partial [Armatimonadetes bacterium]|nr:DUF4159 domain-containing protein [Armatimonadota bacterium]